MNRGRFFETRKIAVFAARPAAFETTASMFLLGSQI